MQPTSSDVAVVTGAGRGIGRAIAGLLVGQGYVVLVTDVDEAAARRTAQEIGAAAGVGHDVRDEAAHDAVAATALELAGERGRLAVWCNNAGVGDDGTLRELSSEAVRRLVEVNLLGVVWGMRAALGAFGDRGGDIVNTASLSGLGPVPGLSVYAATKAAVVSLTTSVQAETPRAVRVHALCPDGVDTALVEAMDPHGMAKELNHSGGGRLTVEETAAAAVALIGSRRVVRTVPRWRGGLVRASALAPGAVRAGLPVARWLGRRGQRRQLSRHSER